jgi:hypothetical protein
MEARGAMKRTNQEKKGGTMKIQTPFPKVREQPVAWISGYYKEAEHYKAIVDVSTGKLFSIVSKDYRLIRHEEAIEEVEYAIAKNPGFENYMIETEFYNAGGRMRRRYCFPEISVEIKKGEEICLELNLFNSYDTTWPFIVLLGAFRFVCENGLVVGKKFLYVRKRHVFKMEEINLEDQVSTAMKRFRLQTKEWKKWTDRQLTPKTHKRVMKVMQFGKKATEEVQGQILAESKGRIIDEFPVITVWVFFNILTWYITHRTVSLNHRVAMERKLRASTRYFRER